MARTKSSSRIMSEEVETTPNEEMSESYISIGLGLLVVVVVGILLYNYFTQKSSQTAQKTGEATKIGEEATVSAQPGTTYKVQAGDTLWSIAVKSYNDGYKWPEIAKANNLSEGQALEADQELKIPELGGVTASPETPVALASPEVSAAQPAPTQTAPVQTITGNSYKIVAGDTLWSIACRAYRDCYAWPRIYQANKNQIVNPDLIYAGNTLTLPR